MPTIDDAFAVIWKAVKASVPLNIDAAIYKAWRQHYLDWGSPISNETPLDSGGVYQVFTRCIVQWTPERGVEVVTQ